MDDAAASTTVTVESMLDPVSALSSPWDRGGRVCVQPTLHSTIVHSFDALTGGFSNILTKVIVIRSARGL